jgi:predicted nucleotidyltransferase
MKADQDPILNEICMRLNQEFNPKKIYLFGSRARGDHKPDSDYDLVLVIDSSDLGMIDRNIQAGKVLWGIKASVDVFVYTQAEFDLMKDQFNSIAELTMHEGRELTLG